MTRKWVREEGTDNHGHFYEGAGGARCRACHGADLTGTPLARAAGDRSYRVEGRTVQIAKGQMVRCDLCHRMPGTGDF